MLWRSASRRYDNVSIHVFVSLEVLFIFNFAPRDRSGMSVSDAAVWSIVLHLVLLLCFLLETLQRVEMLHN